MVRNPLSVLCEVSLAATGDPKEIIKTIDAGLDAFLSVPPERFMATVKTLKAATSEAAKQPACNLICTPDVSQVEKVTEILDEDVVAATASTYYTLVCSAQGRVSASRVARDGRRTATIQGRRQPRPRHGAVPRAPGHLVLVQRVPSVGV